MMQDYPKTLPPSARVGFTVTIFTFVRAWIFSYLIDSPALGLEPFCLLLNSVFYVFSIEHFFHHLAITLIIKVLPSL
jgi:hypothetical protein